MKSKFILDDSGGRELPEAVSREDYSSKLVLIDVVSGPQNVASPSWSNS
ncbi:MAG: hypothetical protein M3Q79_03735 [bacterium]|nr:hypothetical protein [bacterium]